MPSELKVLVWRGARDGYYESFAVTRRANHTVLDVVTYVQCHLDGTLAYRYACRVGMRGCAMTVNGRPRWTCRTRISEVAGRATIEIGYRDRAA